MSVLNTTLKPFKATAFKDGKFVDITDADVKGKWQFSSSIPPISPSSARRSLKILPTSIPLSRR